MAATPQPVRVKRPRGGRLYATEQPALLEKYLHWYLVDHMTLGRAHREIARLHGVHRNTVWPALRRIKALLPTIRELIPK